MFLHGFKNLEVVEIHISDSHTAAVFEKVYAA